MKQRDQGMTILEVVVAITIFLIGVGFIVQSNTVAFRYQARQEIRQQMIFYAAGQLEAALEKHEGQVSEPTAPFNTFRTTISKNPPDEEMINNSTNGIDTLPLQEIAVTVSAEKNGGIDPNIPTVTLKTYRVWTTTP